MSIIDVAERLGMKLYGMGKVNKRCMCPFHNDHTPSLHLNATKNIYKCFSCGQGGDVIGLVSKMKNIEYVDACQWLMNEFSIVQVVFGQPAAGNYPKLNPELNKTMRNFESNSEKFPSVAGTEDIIALNPDIVKKMRSLSSVFCQSLLACHYMTYDQLKHASQQYHLGMSQDGGVVFWLIDEQQRIRTGKVMYYQTDCHRIKSRKPTWMHALLKRELPEGFVLHRCLFGQHLLSGKAPGATVCVVESEKTALICSEHLPDCAWLACGGLQMLSAEMLQPLVDFKVVIFPDTDLTGDTYQRWHAIALEAQKRFAFRYPLRVSRLLEAHASTEQKQRKIDIADFLFEG